MTSEAPVPESFAGAAWIWYDRDEFDLVNSWMQARRSFRLARVPDQVPLVVTADSRYRLWVNGIHAGRGPARGFQGSWPYDTVDIAPLLSEGENVLAVLVHNYGVGTFQYVHAGSAGLLVGGSVGEETISTGPEWRVRPAPGHLRKGRRVSLELGFQEHFDARRDDGSWMLAGYDDSEWRKPWCRAVGCMPWPTLQPRGVPPLVESLSRPGRVVSRTSGDCLQEWEERSDVVGTYLEESRRWVPVDRSPDLSEEGSKVRVPAGADHGFTGLCLDFGREVTGSIILRVEGTKGGEVIDTLICEGMDGPRPLIGRTDVGSHPAFGNRLVCSEGKTEHEQFEPWGFRYLVVVARRAGAGLGLSVELRAVAYPLNVQASLSTSDPRVDRIYRMCVRTQSLCMLDAHVDCPWREQAQWWGDARVQGKNVFYLGADTRLFRRGLIQIGTQEVPNGLTYGVTPTSSHRCILPDYSLVWLLTHRDYYWQTGDLELFREFRPRVGRLLGYFAELASKEGLIPFDDRYWLFLDWFPLFREGYSTLYNMIYLSALRSVSELLELCGEPDEADRCRNGAAFLERAILDLLWDGEEGVFLGGLDREMRSVRPGDPHSLAMAVLLDLMPDRNRSFADDHLLPMVRGEPDESLTPSPYFMHYVFEALKATGNRAEVLDCILRWWGDMLDRGLGTTEEVWNARAGKHSLCHAWSAHPLVHLSDVLLGVRQTAPGWSEVRFAPGSAGPSSVSGGVATPHGPVEVSRRREGSRVSVELNLPEGVTADVRLPGQPARRVRGGRFAASFEAER